MFYPTAQSGFWARMRGFIGNLFHWRKTRRTVACRRQISDGLDTCEVVVVTPKVRRPAASRAKDLRALLENLSITFDELSKADSKHSWTIKPSRVALRNMGPFVPPSSFTASGGNALSPRPRDQWPQLIFVSLSPRSAMADRIDTNGDTYVNVQFMYAIRANKAPWHCRNLQGSAGVIYECGEAVEIGGKIIWAMFYVSIDPDTGVITPAIEMQHRMKRLPDGSRYTQKVFDYSFIADNRGAEWLMQKTKYAFDFWFAKDSMWKVSARRDGKRITFCVPPQDTKHFFKDRGATAMASDGRRKRIIHHVRPHQRRMVNGENSQVREHIRGLRSFDWNDYRCAVTAPEFHRWNADDLSRVPMLDEDEVRAGERIISLERIAGAMADMEDDQQPFVTEELSEEFVPDSPIRHRKAA